MNLILVFISERRFLVPIVCLVQMAIMMKTKQAKLERSTECKAYYIEYIHSTNTISTSRYICYNYLLQIEKNTHERTALGSDHQVINYRIYSYKTCIQYLKLPKLEDSSRTTDLNPFRLEKYFSRPMKLFLSSTLTSTLLCA